MAIAQVAENRTKEEVFYVLSFFSLSCCAANFLALLNLLKGKV
jgi:hypothetical protein